MSISGKFTQSNRPGSRKHGSALLFLAIIAVVLGIIGVAFNRQASDSRYITRRQAHSMFLRSFAQTAAHFALVKLQSELTSDHWLATSFLGKNLDELQDITREIGLEEYYELLQPMIEALEHEGSFSWQITVSAQKADFSTTHLTHIFPPEKSGLIRLKVKTSLKGFAEEFNYVAPVKVTSPLLPALSRFNFFLKNAAPDGDDLFYNQIKNDFRGTLRGNSRPLVLNNGFISPQDLTWDNLLNQAIGLVFLGGGEVRLNLSAAIGSDISDYGESFHFYKRSKPLPQSPFYMWNDRRSPPLVDPLRGNQPSIFLRYDLGISEPDPQNPLRDITAQVMTNADMQYPDGAKEYQNSSLLRLFGTDREISPTLILGKVYRGFLSVSAAKVIPPGYPRNEMFIYPRDLDDFNSMLSRFEQGQVARLLFPAPRNEQHLAGFRSDFASGISYQPYNLSLAFIATRNDHAGPLAEIDRLSPELARSMSHNAEGELINAEALELPEFLAQQANSKNPEDLLKLFNEAAMQPDRTINSRFSWMIDMKDPDAASDLTGELRRIGLYRNGSLNLNGWAFIQNPPPELLIDQPIKLSGNGGLVLGGPCSLTIRSNIDATRDGNAKYILQIVALEGDIIVDTASVDAALITPSGQIQFKRNAIINGAMIMHSFNPGSNFPGATLKYNPALAMQPVQTEFKRNLCWSLQTLPMLVPQ